jgi:hypothetical protein
MKTLHYSESKKKKKKRRRKTQVFKEMREMEGVKRRG